MADELNLSTLPLPPFSPLDEREEQRRARMVATVEVVAAESGFHLHEVPGLGFVLVNLDSQSLDPWQALAQLLGVPRVAEPTRHKKGA